MERIGESTHDFLNFSGESPGIYYDFQKFSLPRMNFGILDCKAHGLGWACHYQNSGTPVSQACGHCWACHRQNVGTPVRSVCGLFYFCSWMTEAIRQ